MSEATALLRALAKVHKQALREGNDRTVQLVEELATEVMSGNNLPFNNIRLMMASYWPLTLSEDKR